MPGWGIRIMQVNLRFKNIKAYLGIVRFEIVEGYNSKLPDGKHCLFWDFDDTLLGAVKTALEIVQHDFKLPNIYVLQTSERGFHANCWMAFPWIEARKIVASTLFVDKKFLAISIMREFFTLRFSPAEWGEIKWTSCLGSSVPETVDPLTLTSFARYKKTRKG